MIPSYFGLHHTNRDSFLQHFAYALRTAVHQSTWKNPVELFLGRKIVTSFHMLAMVPDSENKFVCQDVDKLVKEARSRHNKAQKRQAVNCNMKRKELEINFGDFVSLGKQWL